MQLCICALMTSGLTAIPQSTAHTTRSTLIVSPVTVTSATCATTVPNDSWTATPRPRPFSFENGLSQPAFSAARRNAAACLGCFSRCASRKATGSLPASCANSSNMISLEIDMWEWPTERHQRTGSALFG